MLNVEKSKQSEEIVKRGSEEDLNFFSEVVDYKNNPLCSEKFEELKNKSDIFLNARGDYLVKFEKWCFGYYKAAYSETWTDEYSTPLDFASNDWDEASDKYDESYASFVEACFV